MDDKLFVSIKVSSIRGEPGEGQGCNLADEVIQIPMPMGSNLLAVLELLLSIPRQIQMLIME